MPERKGRRDGRDAGSQRCGRRIERRPERDAQGWQRRRTGGPTGVQAGSDAGPRLRGWRRRVAISVEAPATGLEGSSNAPPGNRQRSSKARPRGLPEGSRRNPFIGSDAGEGCSGDVGRTAAMPEGRGPEGEPDDAARSSKGEPRETGCAARRVKGTHSEPDDAERLRKGSHGKPKCAARCRMGTQGNRTAPQGA
jgi:hypothetical protein